MAILPRVAIGPLGAIAVGIGVSIVPTLPVPSRLGTGSDRSLDVFGDARTRWEWGALWRRALFAVTLGSG